MVELAVVVVDPLELVDVPDDVVLPDVLVVSPLLAVVVPLEVVDAVPDVVVLPEVLVVSRCWPWWFHLRSLNRLPMLWCRQKCSYCRYCSPS